MKIKVGINGMGRIGRMIVRSIIENDFKDIEIKHINNLSSLVYPLLLWLTVVLISFVTVTSL